jgi:hypothetical protein
MKIDSINRGEYQNSEDGYEPGISISVVFTDAEWNDLLLSYDETSSTSPSVSICRPIVRAMLDAGKDK